MMSFSRTSLLALSLFSLSSFASADVRVFANTCGLTCNSLLSRSHYVDCNPVLAKESKLGCFCSSNILAETFALCVATYCGNRADIYSELSRAYCHVDNFNGLEYNTALQTGKENAVHFGTFNTSLPIKAPYVWPAPIFESFYRSTDTFYYQLERGSVYGGAMVAFLGFFLVLAIIRNITVKVMYFWRLPRAAFTARPSKVTRLMQRFIVYPALFSGKHINRPKILGVYLSLPTRAQSLIIFGYLLIGFVTQFVSYDGMFFAGNKFFGPDSRVQLEEYIAARTGIMAFMQLPYIFLFAGRNNFMIALTGWSYTTFNVYHKWVSRAMWSLAMIHGCTFTAAAIRSGRLQEGYGETFWRWGVVALTIAGFIMFQAVYNFRKIAYEAFLVIHIVLVSLFVVGIWYHNVDNGWMQYVYCAIAVWAFDRFVRLLRVIYFNFGFSGSTSAEVAVIGEEHYPLIQIKVRTTRRLTAKPGQYLFLHIGTICPWQAHPFSILEQDDTGAYVLVAKVHKGLTRNLYNHVLAGRKETTTIPELTYDAPKRNVRAGIDGLYGGPSPVDLYDTVLLVAGGVGITGVYAYMKHILSSETASTRHIKLVWAVRHTSTMAWLQPQLQSLRDLAQGRLALDIHLYISNERESGDSSEEYIAGDITPPSSSPSELDCGTNSAEKILELRHDAHAAHQHDHHDPEKSGTAPTTVADVDSADDDNNDDISRVRSVIVRPKRSDESMSRVPVSYARPDLTRIVTETVAEAPSSTAVLVCGPGSMADELRGAVCGNVENAKGRLDFFEEAFEW